MKLALLSVFLALPLLLPAQTAKVIQLSPEDAAKAKSLYQQKDDIEKQISDLQTKIGKKYLYQTPNSDGWLYWAQGFEFSDDFKFIVPNRTSGSATISINPGWPCPNSNWISPALLNNTTSTSVPISGVQ